MGAAKKHGPAAHPGIDVGKSGHGARAPGIAKADAIDAEVIARTAMGMPRALGQIAAEDAAARSLRAPSSQREHAVASGTGAKNRFRAVPLEADP